MRLLRNPGISPSPVSSPIKGEEDLEEDIPLSLTLSHKGREQFERALSRGDGLTMTVI
jgi:hypothetical protein